VWKETSGPELRYHPVINLAVPRLEPVISRISISILIASVSLLSSRDDNDNQKQHDSNTSSIYSKNNNDHNDSGVDDADQKQNGGKIVKGTS